MTDHNAAREWYQLGGKTVMDVITEAMADNPLSKLTMKPELSINTDTKYVEQVGWRVTWEQVNSQDGGMIAWQLFALGKTPQEALQQFAEALQSTFAAKQEAKESAWFQYFPQFGA